MAEKTVKANPFEQWMEQALEVQASFFETSSTLAKSSFKYATELTAEWNKAGVEASRKAMELFAQR